MHDFTGFTTEPIKEIMKEIVDMAKKKKVGGEGFQEMNLRNIQDLIDTIADELMEDDLMDVNSSKPVPDDEEEYVEVVPENKLTSYSLAEGF